MPLPGYAEVLVELRQRWLEIIKRRKSHEEDQVKMLLDYPRAGDPVLERRREVVVNFSVERGYGFIRDSETGEDLFVSRQSVKCTYPPNRLHNLYLGEEVEYTRADDPRGTFATGKTRPGRIYTPTPPETWEEHQTTDLPACGLRVFAMVLSPSRKFGPNFSGFLQSEKPVPP